MFYVPPNVQGIESLDEPLFRLVPAHLQETGVLVMSSQDTLQEVDAIENFPLKLLAASIQFAVRNDRWEAGDLHALLRRYDGGNRWLTEDEERTIARFLVRRLLDYLPQEGSENSNTL